MEGFRQTVQFQKTMGCKKSSSPQTNEQWRMATHNRWDIVDQLLKKTREERNKRR